MTNNVYITTCCIKNVYAANLFSVNQSTYASFLLPKTFMSLNLSNYWKGISLGSTNHFWKLKMFALTFGNRRPGNIFSTIEKLLPILPGLYCDPWPIKLITCCPQHVLTCCFRGFNICRLGNWLINIKEKVVYSHKTSLILAVWWVGWAWSYYRRISCSSN